MLRIFSSATPADSCSDVFDELQPVNTSNDTRAKADTFFNSFILYLLLIFCIILIIPSGYTYINTSLFLLCSTIWIEQYLTYTRCFFCYLFKYFRSLIQFQLVCYQW